eukprot:1833132-Amphidinium_carterae.1
MRWGTQKCESKAEALSTVQVASHVRVLTRFQDHRLARSPERMSHMPYYSSKNYCTNESYKHKLL